MLDLLEDYWLWQGQHLLHVRDFGQFSSCTSCRPNFMRICFIVETNYYMHDSGSCVYCPVSKFAAVKLSLSHQYAGP